GKRFVPGANDAGAFGGMRASSLGRHILYTPWRYLYPHLLSRVKSPAARCTCRIRWTGRRWYTTAMTLLEIKYALASPLTAEQLTRLGGFANTYGLRKFRLNEAKTELSFEYDASRLRETQVAHVLGQASIAVAKRLT